MSQIKVMLLSTQDIHGGAARAAYRLHQGLLQNNTNSMMLVQIKDSNLPEIVSPSGFWGHILTWIRMYTDEVFPLRLYKHRKTDSYSVGWVPEVFINYIHRLNPDLINLHWINGGFIKIETLQRFKRPLVWTLHDMWAFTGGCHYSDDCIRFINDCGNCPLLNSKKENDLSRWGWNRKQRIYEKLDLTIVTPSKWLSEQAQKSSLLHNKRIEIIPNGLDLKLYKPLDKRTARKILGLPQEKKLILFGALQEVESRKGGDLLKLALSQLSQIEGSENYEIVLFGGRFENPQYGFHFHHLGLLRDDISLSVLYAAVDVFIAPSRQDNLPNTIIESLACGTPCVVFEIGGMPDMIDHKRNGYLAKPYQIEDLAMGLKWVLEDEDRWQKLSKAARDKAVREYDQKLQTRRYLDLYQELT